MNQTYTALIQRQDWWIGWILFWEKRRKLTTAVAKWAKPPTLPQYPLKVIYSL